MEKPPPLPTEVLARVLRTSAIDAYSLVFIAGGFGIISFAAADWLGAVVGGAAAGAGVIELRGRQKLRAGDKHGVTWLVRSQLFLLATILAYVAFQLRYFDPLPLLARVEESLASAQRSLGLGVTSLAGSYGLTEAEFQILVVRLTHLAYVAVGFASILCQGGLAVYYHRRAEAIAKALRKI